MSLKDWFGKGPKGDWVDIGAPKKDGKFQACGRKSTKKSKRKYPKCVPRSKARSMSTSQIKSAVSRKRAKTQGVGGKPTNVKTFARKKPKKMEGGGAVAAETQPRKRKVNRQPNDGMIARGCGTVLERKRKTTKLR